MNTTSRSIIKELAPKYYVHSGGGLRSLNDLDEMLKSDVRRCVMVSAEDTLIETIPKDRLIVEISVNEQNEVLIHGRRTNTHVNIIFSCYSITWIVVSAIIQDRNGLVKVLCYMNERSIEETCEKKKIIMKGETSGDIQHILKISLDCDSDAKY